MPKKPNLLQRFSDENLTTDEGSASQTPQTFGQREIGDKLSRSKEKTQKEMQDERVNLIDEISQNYMLRHTTFKELASEENLHKIGEALVTELGDVEAVAEEFDIPIATLQYLIHSQYTLRVYWEIAFNQIKTMSDSRLLRRLKAGDKKANELIHKTLYVGRARGGYNPNEFGALGYEDTIAERQKQHVSKDTEKSEVVVNINFVNKEEIIETEAIDADFIDEFGKPEN